MRGAGRLPISAGVSPVTTCSMTISRPRAQSASSAARMAAEVDGLPSSGTYRRLRVGDGTHARPDQQHAERRGR